MGDIPTRFGRAPRLTGQLAHQHDGPMIESLALLSFRHRWKALIGWILGVVILVTLSSAFAGTFENGGRLVGTDSDAAYQLLGKSFPQDEGETITVAFYAPSGAGLESTRARAAIEGFVAKASKVQHVAEATGPQQLTADANTGVGQLVFSGTQEQQLRAVEELRTIAEETKAAGVEVTYASWVSPRAA
jgi:putative drug exporter of the RND superfamily